MSHKPRIIMHVGGPRFHPVDEQAREIIGWLGAAYDCRILDGLAAFDALAAEGCELFVLMGLHWTGMTAEGAGSMTYHPLRAEHVAALRRHRQAGRPLLLHHGAIASYDDNPEFGAMLGVRWAWGTTTHSPFGQYRVRSLNTRHPVMQGVTDFQLDDELYYQLAVDSAWGAQTHAVADWDGAPRPMVLTAEAARERGRTVYLANGHDGRAFACPALRQLWRNSVLWLLENR